MKGGKWLWPALLAVGVVLAGWMWIGSGERMGAPGPGVGLLRPDDAELVALGRDVYARNCASCHGANLQGQPGWRTRRGLAPAHDASGHTWHHPDALLLQIVRDGTERMGGSMPAFEGALTEREMLAALSFIKSRWPERIRRTHDAINARAGGAK